MINENVKRWLEERGFAERLTEHTETIDTVEHAAQQIGCTEAEIARFGSTACPYVSRPVSGYH